MGKLFYLITTRFYFLLVRIAKPFNAKAKKMVNGRRNQWSVIKSKVESIKGDIVWVHCASLGEFEQGRPIIEKLKKSDPGLRIVVTFFSPSGYEVRKHYPLAEAVFYLPFDSKSNAEKFVEIVNPRLAIFIKYEFWYFYLLALKSRKIPVISASAIFRPGQLFFKTYGGFYRQMLGMFDHLFVQNELSEQLLKGIGLTRQVALAGDTRFDRVYDICKNSKAIPMAKAFKGDQKVFVVGSSWPNDIDLLIPFFNGQIGDIKFIVAPHEINEKNIKQIKDKFKGKSIRFSQSDENSVGQVDLLIIDNVGMLSALYKYGEYAYVGGSFNHGLHNTLEAVTYGIPVFFGKSSTNAKYNEAIDLVNLGAGFEVSDTKELEDYYKKFEEDGSAYEQSAKASKEYVHRNLGATNKIVSCIMGKLAEHA